MSARYHLAGYASVFHTPDLSGDITQPGCFLESLWRTPRLPMLHDHDRAAKLGQWTTLKEDRYGLWVEGVLELKHPAAQAIWPALEAGRLTGLSIGFETQISRDHPSQPGRDLDVVDLIEISLVGVPLLPSARLEAPPRLLTSDDVSTPA